MQGTRWPIRLARLTTRYFVLWVVLAALLAAWQPGPFRALEPAIPALLGVVMLGMGLTLQPADFTRVLRRPQEVGVVLVAQALVMPLAAWALAAALGLPPALAAGVVLVGAAPGGTASNVITALARGDVALSVTATTVATLLAPLLMPAWILLLLGEQVQVGFGGLFGSVATIVLAPVLLGVALRRLLDRRAAGLAAPVAEISPGVSSAAVAVIVAAVVALNLDKLAAATWPVATAVVLHNGIGLAGGAALAWLAGMAPAQRRACAFEVGMQNSGLAVTLALAFFSAEAALAGALFSVWHNITGAALATWLQRRPR